MRKHITKLMAFMAVFLFGIGSMSAISTVTFTTHTVGNSLASANSLPQAEDGITVSVIGSSSSKNRAGYGCGSVNKTYVLSFSKGSNGYLIDVGSDNFITSIEMNANRNSTSSGNLGSVSFSVDNSEWLEPATANDPNGYSTCSSHIFTPVATNYQYFKFIADSNESMVFQIVVNYEEKLTLDAPTISLTSNAGTDNQEVEEGDNITDIVYTYGGTANNFSFAWNGGVTPGGLTAQVGTDENANTFTISGTPTTAGTYGYTIKSTDGSEFSEELTGSIEVTAPLTVPTIELTSDDATTTQSVAANSAITAITYVFGGTANVFDITWGGDGSLPDGIIVSDLTTSPLTISGTPTTAGTYTYSIIATDGTNETASLTGSIEVTIEQTLIPVSEGEWSGSAGFEIKKYLAGETGFSSDGKLKVTGGDKFEVTSSRIQLAGGGSKTSRNVSFEVEGPSYITVDARSSSTDTRTLNVVSESSTIGTISAPSASTPASIYYDAATENKTIYLYSSGSGIHIYGIKVEPVHSFDISVSDVAHGAVTSEVISGTAIPDQTGLHTKGTQVTLTATPESTFKFKHWEVATLRSTVGEIISTENPLTYTIGDGAYADVAGITAVFDVATGVDNIEAAKAIASTVYYTLTGIQVAETDAPGVYVKKVTYKDGSVETMKIVK